MSWIVSFVSLIVIYFTLRKVWWAPIAGVIGQVSWFLYIIVDEQYGLFPTVICHTIIYALSIRPWIRDRKSKVFTVND
jgi:hypothetical protein